MVPKIYRRTGNCSWDWVDVANPDAAVYPLCNMELQRIIDSPFSWAAVGFLIGIVLGVTTTSVWLMAIGLGGSLLYLKFHGPAQHETEGMLFAAGPCYMMFWVLGFIVRGLVF